MRAVVMTAPSPGSDRTEIVEVVPPRPGADEVSIDIGWAGINFMDVMARRGDPGYAKTWPYVPGLEVAGTVREVGSAVTGLAVGQRVAAFTGGGGLAEVGLAKAIRTVPVPEGVPMGQAAAAPLMLTTALLLLTDAARIRQGDAVLVHSASGGVGAAVAQLVRVLGGGRLLGTVGRADKIQAARDSGYDVAIARDGDLVGEVRSAMGGAGVDVVLDPLGTSLLDADLELIAPSGTIVLFGNAGGGQPAPLPPAGRLIGGNVAIRGFSMSGFWAAAPQRAAAALRRVLELIGTGQLVTAVTELASLDQVSTVHQMLADGRGTGKYVVQPGRNSPPINMG